MTISTKPELVAAKSVTEKVGLFIARYPAIEKIRLDPMKVSTSKDPDIAPFLSKVRKPTLEGNVSTGTVEKHFIPLDFTDIQDLGLTTARGPIKVEKHRHPGVMFTVLVSGSLKINGVHLEKGDWYLVPPGAEYELESEHGYETLFGYTWSC